MKKWFLYRVYKLNKGLFVFFILFLAGTLFTNLLGWQVTPFFVWGMYSEEESGNYLHPVLKITVNDSAVINYTAYADANKFFLTSPLQEYVVMKKNNGVDPQEAFLKEKAGKNYSLVHMLSDKVFNDSNEYNLFLPWYKRYLEQTMGIKIHSYTIELLKGVYTPSNKIEVVSAELIDTWKQ